MQPDAVDAAIAAINMEECYRRRLVRGRDLNEWHTDLENWILTGQDDTALGFLGEAIAAVETLEQYDDREPQSYWYEKAADIHQERGDHAAASAVLERWMATWPEVRRRRDSTRLRIKTRLVRLATLARR